MGEREQPLSALIDRYHKTDKALGKISAVTQALDERVEDLSSITDETYIKGVLRVGRVKRALLENARPTLLFRRGDLNRRITSQLEHLGENVTEIELLITAGYLPDVTLQNSSRILGYFRERTSSFFTPPELVGKVSRGRDSIGQPFDYSPYSRNIVFELPDGEKVIVTPFHASILNALRATSEEVPIDPEVFANMVITTEKPLKKKIDSVRMGISKLRPVLQEVGWSIFNSNPPSYNRSKGGYYWEKIVQEDIELSSVNSGHSILEEISDREKIEAWVRSNPKERYALIDVWRALGYSDYDGIPTAEQYRILRTIAEQHDAETRGKKVYISSEMFLKVCKDVQAEISVELNQEELKFLISVLAIEQARQTLEREGGVIILTEDIMRFTQIGASYKRGVYMPEEIEHLGSRVARKLGFYRQNKQLVAKQQNNGEFTLALSYFQSNKVDRPDEVFRDMVFSSRVYLLGEKPKIPQNSTRLTFDEIYALGILLRAPNNKRILERYGIRLRDENIRNINMIVDGIKKTHELQGTSIPDFETEILPSLVQKLLEFAKAKNRTVFFDDSPETAAAVVGLINGLDEQKLTSLVNELYNRAAIGQ